MPNYGLLALLAQQGRREDNAAMGGQVAHISQQDAQILRALGGTGTTNPVTGLPEYFNAGLAGQGFGLGGASGHSAAGVGGTAASFGSFGRGTGGTASGVTGVGPGSSGGGSGLTGPSNATSQQVAKLAQTKAIAESRAKAESLTNWGDAILFADMANITKLGKDAYVKNAFDRGMDAVALNYAKYAPVVNLGEMIFGPGPEGPITFLGEAIYGEGDGQTQTATPSISPTYAPTTGSISTPTLVQAIAEPPPREEKEVAEGELFDLGFPKSPLLAGQRVFDAEVRKTISPEYLAQFGPAIQDVLLQHVADQLLQRAQTQGQLA